MFSVIFEVHPKTEQWDAYLENAKMLRPELEKVDGFVDNIRYKSLTRDGWILSLSGWRDEKSVVRWRTAMRHHMVQEKGRSEILLDYHLRVGQVTQDTRVPVGQRIEEQRLDETDVGEGTTVTFIDAKWPDTSCESAGASETSIYLGLRPKAAGLVSWDVYDAVLTRGDLILMTVWKTKADAQVFAKSAMLPPAGRLRHVRVVRDYGMFDRREAPQYYPPAEDHRTAAHSDSAGVQIR
jgi:heme-degrading monooxygenase HmoA